MSARELFLLPGGLAFGGPRLRLRTLLGSCVAVVVWHPVLRMGGMCHFLLPARYPAQPNAALDGRYAQEALHMLEEQMARAVTDITTFQAHVCGGAHCFGDIAERASHSFDIGRRNIEAAEHWVLQHRLALLQKHTGGDTFRHVLLNTDTGQVSVRHGSNADAKFRGLIE